MSNDNVTIVLPRQHAQVSIQTLAVALRALQRAQTPSSQEKIMFGTAQMEIEAVLKKESEKSNSDE